MKVLFFILLSLSLSSQKIPDDAKHVYSTCAITHIVGWGVHYRTERPGLSCVIGMGAGMIVGLSKEYIWDKKLKRGVFSYGDLADDAWGCFIGGLTLRCIIDFKEVGFVPRKKKNKYYLSRE